MTSAATTIYLRPREDDPNWGPRMRFRLTYEGELKASGRDPESGQRDRMAEHKQAIRKVFHGQLKQLWLTNKFLKEHRVYPDEIQFTPSEMPQKAGTFGGGPDTRIPMVEAIANDYKENGYRFVPLVREEISLLCSLDILFLRRDFSMGVISAGDLDNRVKTLIDTLRKPHNANELRGNESPATGEDPFYCLLADDKLVTGLSVETDMLLDPLLTGDAGLSQVKLVISVELKPANVTMFNLSFA
jgi:hypothetical protein